MAIPLGGGRANRRLAPKSTRVSRRRVPVPRPEVAVGPPPHRPALASPTSLTQPIGRVSPAGESLAQKGARRTAKKIAQRQEIIATRQIIKRQRPRILQNPRQDLTAIAHRQRKAAQVDARTRAIALQQIHSVQDRIPNPAKANRVLFGQAMQRIKQANDIGRLTKTWTNHSNPLDVRVGAIRELRAVHKLPVSEKNFQAFRQAQHFHEFLTNGKEGDTFEVPSVLRGHGLTKTTKQTYQLRKGVPVAVRKDRSLLDVALGHDPHYFAEDHYRKVNTPSIGGGFVKAQADVANYGTKLIPKGKVGTPVRRAITELGAMPVQVPTGLYATGEALGKAALGDSKDLKALAKSFTEDDPLGRLIAHGDLKGFSQHPGVAIAEVLGGAGALDRAAGRVSRRGKAPAIRSIRSAPLTRLAVQERYAKGYLHSKRQRGQDAKRVDAYNEARTAAVKEAYKAEQAAARGDHAAVQGHRTAAKDLAAEAERLNPNRVRERTPRSPLGRSDLGRLADVQEGTNQFRQRAGRTDAIQTLLGKPAIRKSKREQGVVRKGAEAEVQGLIAQGGLAPNKADLAAYERELASNAPHLKTADKIRANRDLRAAISEVLSTHSDADLRLLADDARRYARVSRAVHDEAHAADILPREEARMSALKVFAVRRMGAIEGDDGKLTLPGSEKPLRAEQIEKALDAYAAKNPGHLKSDEIAFVSHNPSVGGPGSFNVRPFPAKGLSATRRSGEAIRYGLASHGRDAMVGTVVRLRNMTSAVKSFREIIENGAARDPDQGGNVIQAKTKKAALERYEQIMTDENGNHRPGYVPGRAVRMNPFAGRAEQLARTIDEADEEGFLPDNHQPILKELTHALEGGDGEGPWTVVAEPFARRLVEHSTVTAGSSPLLRSVTSAFRHTVLPFSPSWITGNVVESGVRSAFAGAGPGSARFEKAVIEELASTERGATAEKLVLSLGTGHLGSASNWHVRNTANAVSDSALGPIKQAAEKVAEARLVGPAVKETAALARAYTNWVMNTVNGTFESGVKGAMAGAFMKEFLTDTGKAGKLTEEAVKQAAHELHSNPAAMDELLRFVQRKFGQYEHFSPEMRRWLINWTPFGAWTFNAVTFLVRNLPQDHPGVVALLAANDSATRQWRREHGLDATIAGEKDSGQVPPWLMGSVPTPRWYADLLGTTPGGPLRIARYTPFGLYSDPLTNIASAFLPQFPLEALAGQKFTGAPLRNSDGTPYSTSQKAAYATKEFALATIPLIGQLTRVVQKGGSIPSGVRKVFNPFEPVARPDQKSQKNKAWGGAAGTASGGGWGAAAGTSKSSGGWGAAGGG